jgi:hypothetical protein
VITAGLTAARKLALLPLTVRLLHWQAGLVAEPARSLYEIERGEWRDYDAYVGHPGRSPAGMHVAEFGQRVQEWRQRFLRTTAQAVAHQLTGLGWERILLAGEPRVTGAFRQELPEPVAGQVAAVVEANLLWEEHTAVADRLDGALEQARVQQGPLAARGEDQGAVSDAPLHSRGGLSAPTAGVLVIATSRQAGW